MTCDAFEVVVVPFPFTDSSQSVKRPAAVLSRRAFNAEGHTVMAMITDARNPPWLLDIRMDHESAGLKMPSVVRMKFFTLVPSDIGTGAMQIVVANATGTSAPYNITAYAVQPGLLAPPTPFLVGGRQYVAAILPDGQFALPAGLIPGVASRPARPGEILVIYAIGFGEVTPSIPAGTIVNLANNLAMPLEMTFGSAPASVAWAGLSQGFVGLYQINVMVPDVPDSDAVPLTFTLNGVPGSTTVYTAVQR